MEFFDCNCFIGLPTLPLPKPAVTAEDLLAQMDRSGIAKALVWHVAQRDVCAPEGNRVLADAIAGHAGRLVGCWTLLPTCTNELPEPDEFFRQMAVANVRALRVFPEPHRYLLRTEVMGDWLDKMVATRTPLVYHGPWPLLYDLLRDFPKLVCIISDTGLWGSDRFFRPLIRKYANAYLEFSTQIVAGGVEEFVRACGADRLLFGTGFPAWDHGGMMLALRHAAIGEGDRNDIASGNMERLLAGVKL